MKRVAVLVPLIAILTILVVALSLRQQVFSQQDEIVPPSAYATPVPASSGTIGTVVVGSPMPEPPTAPPTTPQPTATPLPAAPDTGLASEGVLFDFATADLSDWRFGQFFPDPAGAPAWQVEDGLLLAADNSDSTYIVNDVLAIAPATLEAPGSVEVNALAPDYTKTGLLLGYQDDQNYVAVIFGTENASGRDGVTILQQIDGELNILAQDSTATIDAGRWYTLGATVEDNTIRASIDGQPVLSATPATPLAGDGVGLYAGSEGLAVFDNLRVLDN